MRYIVSLLFWYIRDSTAQQSRFVAQLCIVFHIQYPVGNTNIWNRVSQLLRNISGLFRNCWGDSSDTWYRNCMVTLYHDLDGGVIQCFTTVYSRNTFGFVSHGSDILFLYNVPQCGQGIRDTKRARKCVWEQKNVCMTEKGRWKVRECKTQKMCLREFLCLRERLYICLRQKNIWDFFYLKSNVCK